MHFLRWAFPLALSLTSGVAAAEPLTFAQALARANDTAPSLRAGSLKIDAARDAGRAAPALPDPKLTFGIENFPVSGPVAGRLGGDEMTMFQVGVSQDVPNRAKRRARSERAEADIRSAAASDRIAIRNVRIATALAWLDLYYAERRLESLDGILKTLQPMWDGADAGVASGSSRPAQALAPAQAKAALEDERSELRAAVGRARAELARWTDDPAVEVSGAPEAFVVDPVVLRAGLDEHPTLLAYDAAQDQARADVNAAKAEKRPDWSFGVAYGRRDPMFGDMVSANATVSLPLFGQTRQDPVIEARLADSNRVRLEREDALRALRAALESDLADHAMHHEQLMRSRDTLVPLAKNRSDLETASYGANRASLADVLDAFNGLAQAEIQEWDREAMAERDAARIVLTYGSDDQ